MLLAVLSFPGAAAAQEVAGQAGVIAVDAAGVQQVDAGKLQAGLWKVRVQWTVNGEEYFVDRVVVVEPPDLSRNDAVGMGSATVPVAPVSVPLTGPRRANRAPNGAALQRGELFGGTPKRAGETPRAPQRTASFRLSP